MLPNCSCYKLKSVRFTMTWSPSRSGVVRRYRASRLSRERNIQSSDINLSQHLCVSLKNVPHCCSTEVSWSYLFVRSGSSAKTFDCVKEHVLRTPSRLRHEDTNSILSPPFYSCFYDARDYILWNTCDLRRTRYKSRMCTSTFGQSNYPVRSRVRFGFDANQVIQ